MDESSRPAITDSPWFWVLAFSLMALLALVAIGGKYGRRQARLELQYQARERVAEKRTAENNPAAADRINEQASRRDFAAPGDNLIPLWPLAAILIITAVVSAIMLKRGRGLRRAQPSGRPGSLGEESEQP